MNIQIGEETFTNVIVATARQKVKSIYIMLDGSKKVQEAPEVKRLFNITLIRPTSTEITNIETEYDKGTTLNFIHKLVTYTVKFIGDLEKSTGSYEMSFILQEV